MKREADKELFEIPLAFSGMRADVAFSHIISSLTRSQVRKLIEERFILVDGEAIKPSKKLSGGETASITLLPPEPIEAEPENIPIEILYEDDDIVVVNKSAGMTVHPGAGVKSGTLVNALLYKCRGLSGIGGKIRPGIVHRLDKETSGVMVVAKNDFAHQSLIEQFRRRSVKKRYLALVLGNVKEDAGSFTSSIGRHPIDRKRMSSAARAGREAHTVWKVIRRYNGATLVEAEPRTGRTHQIRVHFSENGHPILGDKVYGLKKHQSAHLEAISRTLGRQALHAQMLSFRHPRSGEGVQFNAPLPDDMKEAINLLEGQDIAKNGMG